MKIIHLGEPPVCSVVFIGGGPKHLKCQLAPLSKTHILQKFTQGKGPTGTQYPTFYRPGISGIPLNTKKHGNTQHNLRCLRVKKVPEPARYAICHERRDQWLCKKNSSCVNF